MDYLRAKFDNCTVSRFGFIVRTDRHTDTKKQTDDAKSLTPATVVGVSNLQVLRGYKPDTTAKADRNVKSVCFKAIHQSTASLSLFGHIA